MLQKANDAECAVIFFASLHLHMEMGMRLWCILKSFVSDVRCACVVYSASDLRIANYSIRAHVQA